MFYVTTARIAQSFKRTPRGFLLGRLCWFQTLRSTNYYIEGVLCIRFIYLYSSPRHRCPNEGVIFFYFGNVRLLSDTAYAGIWNKYRNFIQLVKHINAIVYLRCLSIYVNPSEIAISHTKVFCGVHISYSKSPVLTVFLTLTYPRRGGQNRNKTFVFWRL